MLLLLLACTNEAPETAVATSPTYLHPIRREPAEKTGKATTTAEGKGPRVYYDAVHGARHLWNRDNRRYRTDYHTISGWFRFLEALRNTGYRVEAEEAACFDRATLDAFDVFIIGEQTYHARFMTDEERADLLAWVHDGGGLLVTAEHTNAHYMTDVFNLLAEPLPVEARRDSICDTETSSPDARDWVKLWPREPHPVTEGVDAFWFYNGCSLDTPHGVLTSSDTAWSDGYRPEKKPVHNGDKRKTPNELEGPLHGVAAFGYGTGRVVVIGDHNGLSNTELFVADHHRFALNAVRWLAGMEDDDSLVGDVYDSGYDVLVHTREDGGFHLHRKADADTYRLLYGQWGKEPQLRTWADTELVEGHEALVLGAPLKPYSDEELATIDAYLRDGKPVIWAASLASLGSPAARQLEQHLGLKVTVDTNAAMTMRRPLEVMGDPEWTAGVLRLFAEKGLPTVRVEGTDPVVQLRHGAWHIEERHSDRPVLYDVVSRKAVGEGTFWVFAPLDLFDDTALPDTAGQRQDVVRQQAAELAIRLLKIPLGDTTRYED